MRLGFITGAFYASSNLITLFFLFFIFFFMPAAGIHSYLHIKRGKPLQPKRHRYWVTITVEIIVLLLAIASARHEQIVLFPTIYPSVAPSVAVFLYMLLILYKIRASFPKAKSERIQRMRRTLPENNEEMKYWIVISFLAGISEEIAYRGVAYSLLLGFTDSIVFTVVICSVVFGIAHAMQGGATALAVALFGVAFHISAIGTGSLYLGMLLHVCYDMGLGLVALQFFQRDAARTSVPATS
jgi:membrane protease YdiL (CAAX protease family)